VGGADKPARDAVEAARQGPGVRMPPPRLVRLGAGGPSCGGCSPQTGGRQQSDYLLAGAAEGMVTTRTAKIAKNKTMNPP